MANVLMIGSGGREHSLGWNIGLDKQVEKVFYAPGNPGTAMESKGVNVNIIPSNFETFGDYCFELSRFIKDKNIDLTVIGPEGPLSNGIVDKLSKLDVKTVWGATEKATMIEADKFYSHKIMDELKIPQAFGIPCTSLEQAIVAIKYLTTDEGVVIKARGLTEGKGVYVCDSLEDALNKIKIHAKKYGEHVLISERRSGEELSVFGLSDGNMVYPIEMSFQDHKPLLNGDKGDNTGGMGAYGPAPVADIFLVRHIVNTVMNPVVRYMRDSGNPYKGFLYAGMMKTKGGIIVIEFNARFGDPEAQPAMMMLKDSLYVPILHALDGKGIDLSYKPGASNCVILSSVGYPDSSKITKGFEIKGLEDITPETGVKVFHSGTKFDPHGKILTWGGRVLGITSYSENGLSEAQKLSYDAAYHIKDKTDELNKENVFHLRDDIGDKGIIYQKQHENGGKK